MYDAAPHSFSQTPVYVSAVETADPPHTLTQADVTELSRNVFGSRTKLFEAVEPVFANAKIDTRYSAMPLEWYWKTYDFETKMKLYRTHGLELVERASIQAMEAAGLMPEEIDAIVLVSTTGIATPSLDAELMNRLPFRASTTRIPIFGYGCAGGIAGLNQASRLVQTGGLRNVLFVAMELCTLSHRFDRITKSTIVSTALFGDGCAAMVLSSQPKRQPLASLGASGDHLWRSTQAMMGWDMDTNGFEVVLHRSIPEFVRTQYPVALNAFLEGSQLAQGQFGRACCHPGGIKVLEAFEEILELEDGALDVERDVLRDHGNMSSPTVLYVLQRLLARGEEGPLLATALGPGFSAAFMEVLPMPT